MTRRVATVAIRARRPTKAQPPQPGQHEVAIPTVPPRLSQRSTDDLILHLDPHSRSVVQVTVGSFAQVPVSWPVSMTHSLVGIWQVTKPGFPQVDRAAHFVILPLQFVGMSPWAASWRTACATQLT